VGLAARGWIVAAPDHSDAVMSVRIRGGETGDLNAALAYLRDKKPFNRADYAYRPREVRATLDAMLTSTDILVDKTRVALAGHSMGGWSVMTVALEDQELDVKAVILYSMGELNWWLAGKRYFEAEEFIRLKMPTIYFYGGEEKRINPRGPYAIFCQEHSPKPSELVEVLKGNHFVYNDRDIAPRSGGRPEQIRQIVEASASFLKKYVTGTSTIAEKEMVNAVSDQGD